MRCTHASSLEFLGLDKRNIAVNLGLEGLREEKTNLSTKFPAVNLLCSTSWVVIDDVVDRGACLSKFLILLGNETGRKEFAEVSLNFVKEETVAKSEGPVCETWNLVCSCLELLNFDRVLASNGLVRDLNNEIVQILEHILGIWTWSGEVHA